jgi:NTE family protein
MGASRVIPRDGSRVGLVLGGGGVRGAVFHAAALAALEIDLGWDARTADVVVGTSAGAIMGVLLRLGVSGTDLAAMVSDVPQHAEHELIANGTVKPLELPDQGWRNFLPPLNLRSSLQSLAGQLRNPAAALLSLYGAGEVEFLSLLDFIPAHTNKTWPEQDLRICAVRNDFNRIVWDARSSIGLDVAVSSSCSMPGYASGVDVDGWTYFDGGLHSPTNADVLCGTGIDFAIILSPMTPERQSRSSRRSLMSRFAERRLAAEVSQLRERGVETVILRSPSRVARASSGIDTTMRQPEVGELAESFFLVGSRLSRIREAFPPDAAPENVGYSSS